MFLFFIILAILEIVTYGFFIHICGFFIAMIVFIASILYGFSILIKQHSKIPSIQPENINHSSSFHNITLYFAGILLLMPGLITDVIGFLLTFYFVRVLIQEIVISYMQNNPIHYMMVLSKKFNSYSPFSHSSFSQGDASPSDHKKDSKNHTPKQEKVIEGNFEILHDNEKDDKSHK